MLILKCPIDGVFQKMDHGNCRCQEEVHHHMFYATIHAILVGFYLREEILLIKSHCIQPI